MPARRNDTVTKPRNMPYARPDGRIPDSSTIVIQEPTPELSQAFTAVGSQDVVEIPTLPATDVRPPTPVQSVPEIVNIAKSGVLILVVGAKRSKLLVSSYMLRAASSFFDEAWTSAIKVECTNDESIIKEIDLQDDDVDAVTILCNVLHLRSDLVPNVKPDRTLVIARLVHKYSIQKAVHLAAGHWLAADLDDMSVEEMGALLVAADLMDHAVSYAKVADHLMLNTHFRYYEMVQAMPHESLWCIAYLLEQRRNEWRISLSGLLSNPCIKKCLKYGCFGCPVSHCKCSFNQDFVRDVRAHISKQKLDAKYLLSYSILQILEDVRRLREAPAAKREEYEKCKAEHPSLTTNFWKEKSTT